MKNIYYILAIITFGICASCDSAENDVTLPANKFDYLSFKVSEITLDEKDAETVKATLIYSSTTPLTEDLTVNYSISYPATNAAEKDVDFSLPSQSGVAIIPAGKYTAEVELLSVINNDVSTGKRKVTFNLQPINNVTLGKPSNRDAKSITITINEDDLFEFGYTNFAEVPTFNSFERYPRPGESRDPLANIQDTDASSEAPYVSFTNTTNELGFVAAYSAGSGTTKVEKEIMGVYNNAVASAESSRFQTTFNHGNQGYVTSDLDGVLKLTFDEVEGLTSDVAGAVIELTYYFHNTSWETEDGLALYFETADGLGAPLFSVFDDDAEAIEGEWRTESITIPNEKLATGKVVITMNNSSGKEMIMIDKISIKGIKN